MSWRPTNLAADPAGASRPRALTVADQDLLVVGAAGAWYAIEDRCSHAGCVFSEDGEIDGTQLVCNCHGSEFDIRTGEATGGPARLPIRTYPVRVTAGLLEVDV